MPTHEQITDLAAFAGKTIARAVFEPGFRSRGLFLVFDDGTFAYAYLDIGFETGDEQLIVDCEPDECDLEAAGLLTPDELAVRAEKKRRRDRAEEERRRAQELAQYEQLKAKFEV